MAWRDCQPYGNPEVQTPHMQALAEAGITFHHMYTATAMCAPTRQQLYTGLFPVRNGAYPNHSEVRPGVKSLAHHFQGLGYRVALIGKQHYGPEASFSFEYLGVCLDKIDQAGKSNRTLSIFTSEQGAAHPFAKWTCYKRGLKTAFIARWPGVIPAGAMLAAWMAQQGDRGMMTEMEAERRLRP